MQDVGWNRADFDLHVDAVKQGTRYPALVAQDLVRRTVAKPSGVPKVAAWAGVHGSDQLKAGREVGVPCGAGDGDAAGFEWLAQYFQYAAVEFGY